MIVKGLGGKAFPVARRLRSWSYSPCLVNIRTLHGWKTIGIYEEAIAVTSVLKNLMYFSLSPWPGLGS